jgi:uridylate kinase
MPPKKAAYKRVLLKLSGEALMGKQAFGVERDACRKIATAVKEVHDLGVQVGIVVGGGNIFRGSQAEAFGFLRTPADHIGMLATTINGLVLSQSLESIGVKCHVMSALNTDSIVEPYHWSTAMKLLDEGEIVIFVGGTGNPHFTTDTAAALRASEMNADVVIKATKVDGVYDKDPMKYRSATKFDRLSYEDVLTKNLSVMDGTAIALCRDSGIPIHVINLFKKDALMKAVIEKKGGSIIGG